MDAMTVTNVWAWTMFITALLAALSCLNGHRRPGPVLVLGGALAGQMGLTLALGWTFGTFPNALATLAPTLFH